MKKHHTVLILAGVAVALYLYEQYSSGGGLSLSSLTQPAGTISGGTVLGSNILTDVGSPIGSGGLQTSSDYE
jgi:hypothetical protein